MKGISLILKSHKGVALIAAYLIIAALIVFIVAFFNASVSQNSAANQFKRQLQSFNLAEAGLDKAVNWLRAQASPPVGNRTNPWGGVISLGNGTYSVVITDMGIQGGNSSVHRYKIVSTATVGGISQTLTGYVQNDNYARFIWFTDRETYSGTNVWFWDLDHLNGPTQTNGHFNIFGDPIFDGEARSVDDYIRYYNNGNNINSTQSSNPPNDEPQFNGGLTLGVDSLGMPSQALSLRTASTNGGLRLSGNSTVVLNADGTMNVTNSARGWSNMNMPLPANGALFVDSGNLTVSGTLNGRLTVGSSQDILIPGNIIYANDPRTNPSSNDMLGILAESDVVISHNASYDLEIDASIMALSTSFLLQNYWDGPAKGTLTVYGGIIQDERGPVGTFNGGTRQKLSGYTKDYAYDSRMLASPPPFYPTTKDYVTLSWED